MTTVFLALATGMAFGAVTRWVGVPVPAPPTLAGVLGVAGVTLGYYLAGLR